MNSLQVNFATKECSKNPTELLNGEWMAPDTLSCAFEHVTKICSAFQYDHFLIATAPDVGGEIKTENIMLTNLPTYLTGDLSTMQRSGDWSVLLGMENTLAPFGWHNTHGLNLDGTNDGWINPPSENSAADRLFVEHLQTTSIDCVQAPTRDHKRAFIAAFSSSATTRKIPSEFVLAFLKIFDRIERLINSRTSAVGENLTDREVECLKWASVGKTSAEIAVITGLSEHTVNHYLNSSCKKLDCLNRTQAVAKVLRCSIIT